MKLESGIRMRTKVNFLLLGRLYASSHLSRSEDEFVCMRDAADQPLLEYSQKYADRYSD